MLRIPLPEDDGFALALPEKPRGGGRIQTGVQPPIRDCNKNHPLPAPLAQGRGKGEGVAVDRGLRVACPRL